MNREVAPEYLDELPADHPDAIRSRADLRLINGIMGNHRWIARQVQRHWQSGWQVMELGAGDGGLARSLIKDSVVPADCYHAIDLAPPPIDWPAGAHWCQGDVLDAAHWQGADLVIANLFLHHFHTDGLASIGQCLRQSTRCLIASEPARRRLHEAQGALLTGLADLNWVTGHDMITSIRAGFKGDELPSFLGLGEWQNVTSMTLLGAYRMTSVPS
ncbi:MAG: hypothetical protein H7A55_00985 [Verrucomicrobiaceae bacterium]|nr:hypothetical protein [Verrucomicrobiaceae bacterium]